MEGHELKVKYIYDILSGVEGYEGEEEGQVDQEGDEGIQGVRRSSCRVQGKIN